MVSRNGGRSIPWSDTSCLAPKSLAKRNWSLVYYIGYDNRKVFLEIAALLILSQVVVKLILWHFIKIPKLRIMARHTVSVNIVGSPCNALVREASP